MNESIKAAREQQQQAYNNAVNFIALVTNQPNYKEELENNIRNVSNRPIKTE
jgi:hypothetical protein